MRSATSCGPTSLPPDPQCRKIHLIWKPRSLYLGGFHEHQLLSGRAGKEHRRRRQRLRYFPEPAPRSSLASSRAPCSFQAAHTPRHNRLHCSRPAKKMDQPARDMCGIRSLLAPAGGHEGPLPELLLPSHVGSTQVVTSRHVHSRLICRVNVGFVLRQGSRRKAGCPRPSSTP